jgi:hypothetical protein
MLAAKDCRRLFVRSLSDVGGVRHERMGR